jgi:hypothetical protein
MTTWRIAAPVLLVVIARLFVIGLDRVGARPRPVE